MWKDTIGIKVKEINELKETRTRKRILGDEEEGKKEKDVKERRHKNQKEINELKETRTRETDE